jgi:hypothetical protein
MRVLRVLGAALVVTCAAMACSDPPSTPTSASSPSTTATATGGSASPFAVKYTVTAAAGANGKISPSGVVNVDAAGIQGFTLAPDPNYHVTDVVVDGNSVGAVASYTFTNVLANHTIAATFAINDTLDGLYVGTLVLSAVGSGECVGADLQANDIGKINNSTVSITTQQQYDVTAIVRSFSTGLFCTYKGNTRSGLFAANDASDRTCNSEILLQCTNGNSRILIPVGSTITASVSGNTASGIVATTFNVLREDSTGKRFAVGGLTTQETFNATRR